MNKLYIFDFDGTLIHNYDHPWVGDEFNWETFLTKMERQPAVLSTITALNHALNDVETKVVLCTARPNTPDSRVRTLEHLESFGIDTEQFDSTIFRDEEYIKQEQALTKGVSSPKIVKRIIHDCHAKWREGIADKLKKEYSPEYVALFDDQQRNLDSFVNSFSGETFVMSNLVTPEGNLETKMYLY